MAEALAGLGLAANIAQFVGLSMQLLLQGKEIYDSISGTREEYDELELMVTQTQSLIEDIIQADQDVQNAANTLTARTQLPSRLEREIRQLATQCHPILDRLLGMLSDLKIPKDARFRTWQAVKQTFRHAGKKKDLQELKERLFDLDLQLRNRISLLLQV
ncbi:hypothetical protein BDV96DRAFT_136942 [Lophiotrema nucula]|uniref:NACHT-NTPase and P-loop NTPases N-terminal domain-containing protein n=1 Tax=Lophiotrema nucula TaxID=690887 RepID=A0A6A5ZSM0_9PLEO|nr:hypothetical protein BDV96DRAFT_136942 [Lophiotrema nucula]